MRLPDDETAFAVSDPEAAVIGAALDRDGELWTSAELRRSRSWFPGGSEMARTVASGRRWRCGFHSKDLAAIWVFNCSHLSISNVLGEFTQLRSVSSASSRGDALAI